MSAFKAKCDYAEDGILFVVVLTVVMLIPSVTMLSVLLSMSFYLLLC